MGIRSGSRLSPLYGDLLLMCLSWCIGRRGNGIKTYILLASSNASICIYLELFYVNFVSITVHECCVNKCTRIVLLSFSFTETYADLDQESVLLFPAYLWCMNISKVSLSHQRGMGNVALLTAFFSWPRHIMGWCGRYHGRSNCMSMDSDSKSEAKMNAFIMLLFR